MNIHFGSISFSLFIDINTYLHLQSLTSSLNLLLVRRFSNSWRKKILRKWRKIAETSFHSIMNKLMYQWKITFFLLYLFVWRKIQNSIFSLYERWEVIGYFWMELKALYQYTRLFIQSDMEDNDFVFESGFQLSNYIQFFNLFN